MTRLQRKDGLGWTWVYARLRPEGPALLAHNFVIRSVHTQRSAVSALGDTQVAADPPDPRVPPQ